MIGGKAQSFFLLTLTHSRVDEDGEDDGFFSRPAYCVANTPPVVDSLSPLKSFKVRK